MSPRPPISTLFPYTTLFRSGERGLDHQDVGALVLVEPRLPHRLTGVGGIHLVAAAVARGRRGVGRSEEHTSELQSQSNLVCRLLLEKKNRDFLFSAACFLRA